MVSIAQCKQLPAKQLNAQRWTEQEQPHVQMKYVGKMWLSLIVKPSACQRCPHTLFKYGNDLWAHLGERSSTCFSQSSWMCTTTLYTYKAQQEKGKLNGGHSINQSTNRPMKYIKVSEKYSSGQILFWLSDALYGHTSIVSMMVKMKRTRISSTSWSSSVYCSSMEEKKKATN